MKENPEILTQVYQTFHSQEYGDMIEFYNQQSNQGKPHKVIDYPAFVETFSNASFKGLNNGLPESENQRLFQTEDLDEMVYLILKWMLIANTQSTVDPS